MNLEKIEVAKANFFHQYPNGFNDEKMKDIEKKHKPKKMMEMASEYLRKDAFNKPDILLDNWSKIVSRSSMVSVFEKPKFKDLTKLLNGDEKEILVKSLYEFLHGNREFGFEAMVDFLDHYKLAKWTLVTIAPFYLKPTEEVFVKPTTTKMAINYFELEGLKYKAKPSFSFYEEYRKQFLKMKKLVNVTEDNAAFGGFIMITADNQ